MKDTNIGKYIQTLQYQKLHRYWTTSGHEAKEMYWSRRNTEVQSKVECPWRRENSHGKKLEDIFYCPRMYPANIEGTMYIMLQIGLQLLDERAREKIYRKKQAGRACN